MSRISKIMIYACCGVMACGTALTSCNNDVPPITAEELYLRNFIKKYGLIDPNQDFSLAENSKVTVELNGDAGVVNAYARVGDDLYRVACFANVEGVIDIPMDVPEFTEEVVIDVDGVRYTTAPGGTVKVLSAPSRAASRADVANDDERKYWREGMTHTGAVIDATTGAVIDATTGVCGYINVTTNTYKSAEHIALGDHAVQAGNYEIGNICNKGEYVVIPFKNNYKNGLATATGGVITDPNAGTQFFLNFRTASNNPAKIRVMILGKAADGNIRNYLDKELTLEDNGKGYNTSAGTADYALADGATQWELKTEMMPPGDYELVIISTEITRDESAYGGNWGFFQFKKALEVSDMAWLMACEDLGTTDDFDFNDVIIRVESVKTNTAALKLGVVQWQVVKDNDEHFILSPASAPARAGESRAEGDVQTLLRVEAMCAGGTLPIWLHFRDPYTKKDYIICPPEGSAGTGTGNATVAVEAQAILTTETYGEKCEWHRWFGVDNHTDMLNTGYHGHKPGKKVEFTVSGEYSLTNFSFIDYDDKIDALIGPNSALDENDDWTKRLEAWKWMRESYESAQHTWGFFVTVYHPGRDSSNSTILAKSLPGLPPQMFLIPDCSPTAMSGYQDRKFGWEWPMERVSILDVYPKFAEWVGSSTNSNWYLAPTAGIIASDNLIYSRDPDHRSFFPTAQDDPSTNN